LAASHASHAVGDKWADHSGSRPTSSHHPTASPSHRMPVSIITPHFNRASLLAETAASVLAALGPDDEWIVVDDGSDPAEWERAKLLSRDPRVRWIARDREPKGPSACRNIGLAKARGNWVLFLDSDDLLAPDCIEGRAEVAQADPATPLHLFPVDVFRERAGDSQDLWNTMGGDALQRFLQSSGPWCVSSGLWQRQALVQLGGFNEAVFYGDDAELHIRALLHPLAYKEHSSRKPDVHVRRSAEPRVTQGMRKEVLDSRLQHLSAVTRLLSQQADAVSLLRIWKGQYFREAEFHLFNQPQSPWPWVRRVMDHWRNDLGGTGASWHVSRAYLRLSCMLRDRTYLLLRVARRMAMPLLPYSFRAS